MSGTIFPDRTDYDIAVGDLAYSVSDPFFRNGTPRRGPNGLIAYSGNYSRVYLVDVGGRKAALRCWTQDCGKQRERYEALGRFVTEAPDLASYFVRFKYVERGIDVQGRSFPIIGMEWAQGKTISEFLDERVRNRKEVEHTAEVFLDLVETLHQHGIAHGDLQDGNLMVSDGPRCPELKLIDYDTIYLPLLGEWEEEPVSVPDYQHPRRGQQRLRTRMDDYFSELVIYLSLRAYAERPELWEVGSDRKMLFSARDFREPDRAEVFKVLATMSDDVQRLALRLMQFCRANDITELDPLEKVVNPPPLALRSFFRNCQEVDENAAREASSGNASSTDATTSPQRPRSPDVLVDFFPPPAQTRQEPARQFVDASQRSGTRYVYILILLAAMGAIFFAVLSTR